MAMKSEQERLKTLLADTITLLCKNGLTFQTEFSIEALIGITLDKNNVFLLSINEIVGSGRKNDAVTGNMESNMLSEQTSPKPGKHLKRKCLKEKMKCEAPEPAETTWELQASYTHSDSTGNDNHGTDGSHQISTMSDESSSQSVHSGRQDIGSLSAKKRKRSHVDVHNSGDNEETIEQQTFVKQEVDGSWEESQEEVAPLSYFPEYSDDFAPEEAHPETGKTAVEWPQSGSAEQGLLASNFPGREASTSKQQTCDADQIATEFTEVMRRSSCMYCSRRFTTHHAVVAHERLHKGEYRYYCSVCGKGFMGKNHLNGHMVLHTGVREFRCPFCAKEYSYKAHLKEHLELKHLEQYTELNLHIKANLSTLISEGAPT